MAHRPPLKIDLYKGDVLDVILGTGADGIVNAANQRLDHGGGIAGRLVEIFTELQGVSNAYMETIDGGRLQIGSAHFTLAGGSVGGVKGVIHAVPPDFRQSRGGIDAPVNLLELASENALLVGSSNRMVHLVEPLLSGAIFRGDLTLDKVAEHVLIGVGSAIRRGITVARLTFVAKDDDTCKVIAIRSAAKALKVQHPSLALVVDENFYAAPLLQDVQQHAVIRALVDGTRHQDEQSSSGRAAEIALSLVARMNSNDQYPQSRRKRPDEKIANIRTEFDRSKLASVLERCQIFLCFVDVDGSPVGEEAAAALRIFSVEQLKAIWADRGALTSYDYGKGRFVVTVIPRDDAPSLFYVLMRPMAFSGDKGEWTTSFRLLVNAALLHILFALLSVGYNTTELSAFIALPRAPQSETDALNEMLKGSLLPALFAFRENNANSFAELIIWDITINQDQRLLEEDLRALQDHFDEGEASKADDELPDDEESAVQIRSDVGGELSTADHYDQSAVMEDGSHLTDIATHVARPLEYLMSYPLGVTPVALLIGISEHGIPEPGVSAEIVNILGLGPSVMSLVQVLAQRNTPATEKEWFHVDMTHHAFSNIIKAILFVYIPPCPVDFDRLKPERKTAFIDRLIQSECTFLGAASELGVRNVISTLTGGYAFGWPSQMLTYAKARAIDLLLRSHSGVIDLIRYVDAHSYLVARMGEMITIYKNAVNDAVQDDMDVDSDEEDKRLKDRALREYKQDSDEQGPQSKANFVVLRRKKKQRREQKIANLKLKPKHSN